MPPCARSLAMRMGLRVVSCVALLDACASDDGKQERPTADSSTQNTDADADADTDAAIATDAGQGPDLDSGTPAVACDVELPRACAEPAPTYADVSPIFEARCVICHAGMAGGPWPLTSYGHVADWQDEIRSHVSRCTMPPPDSGVAISDGERAEILMWLRCGLMR